MSRRNAPEQTAGIGVCEPGRPRDPASAPPPAPAGGGGRVFMLRYALLAAADVAGKVLAYAVTVVVVQNFGAAGYGELSYAAAIVTCALTVGCFGLDLYGMREAARHPDRLRVTIPTIITLRLLLAATVYAVLLSVAAVVPPLRAVLPLVSILGASLFVGSLSLSWVADGLQRAPVIALANVGTQGLFLALVVGLSRVFDGVWVAAAAQVLAELIVAAGVLAWFCSEFRGAWRVAPRATWRAIAADAAPMGWTRVLRAVTLASDLAILGFLVTYAEVGWYGGAFRLYLLFLASVGLYSILLLARLSRCAAAGADAVWREVRASYRRIVPLAVLATVAAAALAEWLLVTMFDPTFAVAAPSLRLLLLALLVSLVSGHPRLALMALQRQRLDAVVVTISTVAHVALKVALIPALGILGAALGHALGEVCLLGLAWYVVRDRPPVAAGG